MQVILVLVPEFLPGYAALADATGDDPGPVEVCAELAAGGWGGRGGGRGSGAIGQRAMGPASR